MKKHNKYSHIQHIHTHHIVKTQNWSHNIQAKDEQDEKCPNKVIWDENLQKHTTEPIWCLSLMLGMGPTFKYVFYTELDIVVKNYFSVRQWWRKPLIPALGKQRQADSELEARMIYKS